MWSSSVRTLFDGRLLFKRFILLWTIDGQIRLLALVGLDHLLSLTRSHFSGKLRTLLLLLHLVELGLARSDLRLPLLVQPDQIGLSAFGSRLPLRDEALLFLLSGRHGARGLVRRG